MKTHSISKTVSSDEIQDPPPLYYYYNDGQDVDSYISFSVDSL